MCLGGGGHSYDAYQKGDYQKWQASDDAAFRLQQKIDSGKLTGPALAQAKRQMQNYNRDANSRIGQVNKDAAARLDVREHERQQDITTGKGRIDKAFTKFNNPYYDKYGQSYLNFYTPQLNDQYAQARGKLTAALAGKGTLESTSGIGTLGRLAKERDTAATTIGNQAQDAKNQLRSNVEKSKSDLYSLNESAADPDAINNRAIGEATALVAPPAFSPIGSVFASFLGGLGNITGPSQQQSSYYRPYSSPFGATGGGSGTVYG